MFIIINSDRDIDRFMKTYIIDNVKHQLDYFYKAPGWRSYINLGEFEGKLFLEIIVDRKKNFQLEWNHSTDIFVKEIEGFGFTEDLSPHVDRKTKFFRYPENFTKEKENRLIEILLNLSLNINIGKIYGLR